MGKARAARPKPTRRDKGSGAVFYRSDKQLWVHRVELPLGLDGKRKQRLVYGKTEGDVRRKIADLTAQGGGTLQPVNKTRLVDYALPWLARIERNHPAKTHAAYKWAWGHAAPLIGNVKFGKLDSSTVVKFYRAMTDGGASAYTVGKVGAVMQTIVESAIADGTCTLGLNPFWLARKSKPKHKAERGRALTLDQVARVIRAARADRLEAAWLLGLTVGVRIGEMFALKWTDINFDERTVHIQRQVIVAEGKLVVQEYPKTHASLRTEPVEEMVLEALERRRAAANREMRSPWVFPSANPASPMNPNNARRRNFVDLCAAAKIEVSAKNTLPGPFTPHDLRYTFNSQGASIGISEKVRSQLMGHDDSPITRLYTRPVEGDVRKAAQAVNSLYADALKRT